jgi:hypothetical protein
MTVLLLAASISQGAAALASATPSQAATSSGEPTVEVGVISSAPATDVTSARAPVRRDHRVRATHPVSPAARAAAPAAVHGSKSEPHPSNLVANFDGVGSRDSGVTNFGAEFEPPDQGLCAGNGLVVEMVNSAYRVYDTKGNSLIGPFNINKVFHDGFTQFTSDPRCHFDAATNTWFAVILFLNDPFTASRLEIAVTADPLGDWTVYKLDTTNTGGNGCPCFGDQPTFGIDGSNIYVTTNEFSIQGPEFNGAQVYAFSKRDLVRNAKKVHFVHFSNLFIAGAQAASVQPALTTGNPGAEYFMSSLDSKGTGDHRIGVWAMTRVNAVGSGHAPRLSKVVINSEPYAVPPPAQQMGSTSTLDSGDDRMQQTQFIGGEIWGQLDTAVTPEDDNTVRAGAAWFRVSPWLHGSVIGGATITGQGYVASAGEYVLYPAIQADGNGHAAMVLTLTGANRFASAGYAVLSDDESGFGQPVVAAAGSGPYDPAATRWGDYSWAVLDPASDSVWMSTEYMPPLSSQTADGLRNWGTRVMQLSLDSQQQGEH